MSPESFNVLIASPHSDLRFRIARFLSTAGFQILAVQTAAEALDAIRQRPINLVVLLFASEDEDVSACNAVRSFSATVGIVAVTIEPRPAAIEAVLDAGADDCITPPLRFREVVARVTAILRRTRLRNAIASVIVSGDLELDVERRLLRRLGASVYLSPREFELLLFLMRNQGECLTHRKILRAVWGDHGEHTAASLRSYIKALRRKIESDPANPRHIVTEPWVGYRFQDPSAV